MPPPERQLPPPVSIGRAWETSEGEPADAQAAIAEAGQNLAALLALEPHMVTAAQAQTLAEALKPVVDTEPFSEPRQLAMVRLYARAGEMKHAELACRLVLQRNLDSLPCLHLLADICEVKGQHRDGILASHRILRLDPKDAPAAWRLARFYRIIGLERDVDIWSRKAVQLYHEMGHHAIADQVQSTTSP
ncbi:MAG TPA: hypothetical protein VGO93_24960 [Candidatus Xenobia bacterium]|jgi:hypothetical protein